MPRGPWWPLCRIPGQAAPGPRIPVLAPEQEGGSHSPGLWKLWSARHPPTTPGPARRPAPQQRPARGGGCGEEAWRGGRAFLGFGALPPPLLFQAGPGASPPPGHAVPWPGLLERGHAGNEWRLTLCSRRPGAVSLGGSCAQLFREHHRPSQGTQVWGPFRGPKTLGGQQGGGRGLLGRPSCGRVPTPEFSRERQS